MFWFSHNNLKIQIQWNLMNVLCFWQSDNCIKVILMRKCVLILLTFRRTQNFTVSQTYNVQCIWFWEKHGYFVTNKMLFVWFALHGSFILAVELLHLPRWSNHLHDRKSTALIHTAGHATKFYEATKTFLGKEIIQFSP